MKKVLGILGGIIVIGLAAFIYFRFYFVFGEGVRNGELNYVVYKGLIFKTYEGKLIQSGLRSKGESGMQSNTFDFSIENKELAEELMRESGKFIELHYKEYYGRLPWRGHTKYVVDKILSVKEKTGSIDNGVTEALINL